MLFLNGSLSLRKPYIKKEEKIYINSWVGEIMKQESFELNSGKLVSTKLQKIIKEHGEVYTSPDITRKTGLIEFSADINFAKYVKVIVQIRNSGGSLIMSDFVLERNS